MARGSSVLSGKFNVYNAMAALCVLLAEGFALSELLLDLQEAPQVPARFEKIEEGQPFSVIVDYWLPRPPGKNA